MEDFKDTLERLTKNKKNNGLTDKHLSQFFRLLNQTKDPCNDSENEDEDCSDILSPCCGSAMRNQAGSLPLKVCCEKCNKSYILRDLLQELDSA